MPELDDDKTDKLFQIGAGRHDFQYDPAAWEKMEGLLAADDLRRKRLTWLLVAGGLVMLLLFVFAGVNYRTDSFAEDVAPSANPEKGMIEKTLSQDIAATSLTAESPVRAERESEQTEGAKIGKTVGLKRESFRNIEATTAGTVEVFDGRTKSELPATGGQADGVAPITETNRHLHTISRLPIKPVREISYSRDVGTLIAIPDELGSTTFTPSTSPSGVAVGLSAGFASGKTRTGGFAIPRLRLGARIDYRLNNYLSFGTGAFLTKVDYKSKGEEYKVGEDFWAYDVVPDQVEADCDILEIPLTLTWHPNGNYQSGFYLGAGLTSYFMLTEQFSYKYDVPDDDLIKWWREDNANQHLLGMGQINVGFQRKTSQRTAFQLESFVQLPLTGIGHGGVNLLTVGASVNYTFDFRRKR